MKKLIFSFLLIFISVATYAQSYVSGNIGFWYETESKFSSFSMAPEYGYFLSERNACGIELNYQFKKEKERHVVGLQPYFRRYLIAGQFGVFVDGTAGVTYTKYKEADDAWGLKIGFIPGVDYQISERFSLQAKLGFLGYYQPDENTKYVRFNMDATDLKIGCMYRF